jgi:hypothetical protein
MIRLIAQNITNHEQSLHGMRVDYDFWGHYQNAFLPFLTDEQINMLTARTDAAGEMLLALVENMHKDFKILRFTLAEAHDVPFVQSAS